MTHAVMRRGATARVVAIRSKHEPLKPEFRRDLRQVFGYAISQRKPKRSPARSRVVRLRARYNAFSPDNRYSVRYLWEPWYVV